MCPTPPLGTLHPLTQVIVLGDGNEGANLPRGLPTVIALGDRVDFVSPHLVLVGTRAELIHTERAEHDGSVESHEVRHP